MKKSKNVNIEEVMENTSQVTESENAENTKSTTDFSNPAALFDIPTSINTLIARNEATGIVVSIINAFIDVLQRKNFEFTLEELKKIQDAVNAETQKTSDLYAELSKFVNAAKGVTEAEAQEDTKSETAE